MIKIKTPDMIQQAISKKIATGSSYIDALVEYADEVGMEVESLADIIKRSPVMREKIREEAAGLNLLPKEEVSEFGKFCQ